MKAERTPSSTPWDEHLDALAALYLEADELLTRELEEAIWSGKLGTAAYMDQRIARVRLIMQELQAKAAPLTGETIRVAYLHGSEDAAEHLARARARVVAINATDEQKVAVLIENSMNEITKLNQVVGTRAEGVLRKASLDATIQGALGGSSVDTRTELLKAAYQRAGVSFSRDGHRLMIVNGRQYKVDGYARLVARTTSREAATYGTLNRCQESGWDLIQISVSPGAEEDECSQYEGRIYSISGKHPKYPPLVEVPPYHANCTHVAYPAPVTA